MPTAKVESITLIEPEDKRRSWERLVKSVEKRKANEKLERERKRLGQLVQRCAERRGRKAPPEHRSGIRPPAPKIPVKTSPKLRTARLLVSDLSHKLHDAEATAKSRSKVIKDLRHKVDILAIKLAAAEKKG